MKKRVHWGEEIVDNENLSKVKRQKKNDFDPQSIESMKAFLTDHFSRRAYDELENKLSKYRYSTRVKILSVDDYYPFQWAAARTNIDALKFIINNVPEENSRIMLKDKNFATFELFLYHERAIEELNKVDHQRRIEGFKIFLKIDLKNLQDVFNAYENKISEKDKTKKSLRDDFNSALASFL